MQYKIIYDPAALNEYEDALHWYNGRGEDASERLRIEIQGKIGIISSDPYRYRNIYHQFREVSLPTFPYYIIYTINESLKSVIVFSIYHHKRNPKKKYKK